MRLLEDSLAERMLSGDIKEGMSAIMDVDGAGQITVLTGSGQEIKAGTVSSIPAGIA